MGQNDPALPVFPHEQSHVLVTTGLMGTVGCAGWEGWAVVCSALSVETSPDRFAANIPLKSNESSDVESVDPSILLRMSCRSTAPRMNIMLHSKSRRLTTSKITNAKMAMTRPSKKAPAALAPDFDAADIKGKIRQNAAIEVVENTYRNFVMLSMNRWSKLKNLVSGFVLSAFLLANLMNSTIAAAMAAIPKMGAMMSTAVDIP